MSLPITWIICCGDVRQPVNRRGIALVTDGAGAPGLALPGGIALACLAWRFRARTQSALFWAELIRGIPFIFVIFWMWYLLPLITGAICRVR
jgi:ABC-type amino acid transport system permease subunit